MPRKVAVASSILSSGVSISESGTVASSILGSGVSVSESNRHSNAKESCCSKQYFKLRGINFWVRHSSKQYFELRYQFLSQPKKVGICRASSSKMIKTTPKQVECCDSENHVQQGVSVENQHQTSENYKFGIRLSSGFSIKNTVSFPKLQFLEIPI